MYIALYFNEFSLTCISGVFINIHEYENLIICKFAYMNIRLFESKTTFGFLNGQSYLLKPNVGMKTYEKLQMLAIVQVFYSRRCVHATSKKTDCYIYMFMF